MYGHTLYDPAGNLASALGGPAPRHYSFDWANRLVGVGSSAGASDVLSVLYDAGGRRLTDYGGGAQRIHHGDHFTIQRPDPLSGFELAEFHVFAFGETVGYKRTNPTTLRSAESAPLLLFREPAPPWAGGWCCSSPRAGSSCWRFACVSTSPGSRTRRSRARPGRWHCCSQSHRFPQAGEAAAAR